MFFFRRKNVRLLGDALLDCCFFLEAVAFIYILVVSNRIDGASNRVPAHPASKIEEDGIVFEEIRHAIYINIRMQTNSDEVAE